MRKILFWTFKKLARLLWGKGLHRLPLVDRMSAFLQEYLRPGDFEFLELEGDKVYFNPGSVLARHVLLFGTYEKLLREVFRREIKPGMTVLDLGAHIGVHTLLAARLVGQGGRVFAFEPSPSNYACLTRNITENSYTNVAAVPKAVSDKVTRLKFYPSVLSLTPSGPVEEAITVDSTALDEFFKGQDVRVDFVKMDIEGAEIAALAGMDNLIRNNRQLKLVVEFNPDCLRDAGYLPGELLNRLTDYGFVLYDVDEKRQAVSVEPADVTSLLQAYDARGKRTNLLCVRDGSRS